MTDKERLRILGGINKETLKYDTPIIADKKNNYICPDCDSDIVLKQGKIKVAHFAHKKNSNCSYYSTPTESQIHKGGKLLLKTLIEDGKQLNIIKKCEFCDIKNIEIIDIYDKSNNKVELIVGLE